MKQVVFVILSLFVLFSSSQQATTFLIWKANQGTIAKTLCIKKEVKGNSCQGKCRLKAQLDNLNEDDSSRSPFESNLFSMPFYCVDLLEIVFNIKTNTFKKGNPITNQIFRDRLIVEKMLRPPNSIG